MIAKAFGDIHKQTLGELVVFDLVCVCGSACSKTSASFVHESSVFLFKIIKKRYSNSEKLFHVLGMEILCDLQCERNNFHPQFLLY